VARVATNALGALGEAVEALGEAVVVLVALVVEFVVGAVLQGSGFRVYG